VRFQRYLLEEIGEDELNLKKHAIFKHKGTKMYDTHHAYVRIKQRNELSMDEMKKLFTEAIDKFKQIKTHAGMHLVFWSKQLKQSFIASVDNNDKSRMTMITYYPRGQKPNKDTHPFQHEVTLA
jgi:hypothetical protein